MFSKLLILGGQNSCNQVITIDFLIPNSNFFLLKGTVYTPKYEPLPNAAIEVIRQFKSNDINREQSIGITFTKEDGTYGMVLPIHPNCDYILVAYSPLNSPI